MTTRCLFGCLAASILHLITSPLTAEPTGEKTIEQALELEAGIQQAGAATQNRVDRLDDATRSMLSEYRAHLQETAELDAYNQQLERMIASQRTELAEFDAELEQIEVTQRQILPLMMRMLEVLEEFIALDAPFLAAERGLRLEELKRLMDRADVPVSDKYRRLMEAYQIEAEYGHSIEAYSADLQLEGHTRAVEFLRFGRVGLYYRSLDETLLGYWNRDTSAWQPLDAAYGPALDHAVRVARRQLPPDLVRLPVSHPVETLP